VAPPAILLEDAALLAVDKPAGRLVIPGRAGGEPSLREELEALHGPLWVVHRLDRGTSGVLLFARTAEAHRALNLQFERGEPRKAYLALVAGLPPDAWRCEEALAPARKGKVRPARPGEAGAKAAATGFEVLERFPARGGWPACALVEARPETGRTHQIRVHLKCAGHPLLVDPDYYLAGPLRVPEHLAGPLRVPGHEPGPLQEAGGGAIWLARTPLHAARLAFRHPDGRALAVAAPLAPDLEAALARLRGAAG
jgi:tRNA pseudouridine32 synthase/23S rRNA pseudouridine746 synthase